MNAHALGPVPATVPQKSTASRREFLNSAAALAATSTLAGLAAGGLLLLPVEVPAAGTPDPGVTEAGDLKAWRPPIGDWVSVRDVRLDTANPERLAAVPGEGVLVNGAQGRTVDLITRAEFDDAEVHVEFCIARHSNSGVYLMGRYEVQIYDSYGVAKDKYPGIECGGIYPRWTEGRGEFEGHSPRVNASKPAGEWQTLEITFRAPRFDAEGRKIANARFVKVLHNGQVVHENVEPSGPTRAAHWENEAASGPLLLQGDHGPVAFRNLTIRPLNLAAAAHHAFFAMDTGTRDEHHLTPESQAKLLKDLGYDGIGWSPNQVPEMLAALDREGLKMFNVYVGVDLNAANLTAPANLLKLIEQLQGRTTAIWLYVTSKQFTKPSDEAGDSDAVTMLRDIADRARQAQLNVALYPHTGFWMERIQDAVRLARKVDRPNLGVTFNLCHCLKVGDESRIPELLALAAPHLMFVTLNGADHTGDWDRLIQPLGRGEFEVASVLQVLRRIGYTGPVGLQHYGIQGDVRRNLQQSMEAWRRLSADFTATPSPGGQAELKP